MVSTLDRLRDLAEIASDELMSDSHCEFFNEFAFAWPKIRDVVEVARRFLPDPRVIQLEQREKDLLDAFIALEEIPK